MHRGTGRRDNGYPAGDSFAGFRGFGRTGSLMSRLFVRDPFDDPFFHRPFGGTLGPSVFDSPGNLPRPEANNTEFSSQQHMQQNRLQVPIIHEISDDDDGDITVEDNRGKGPYVQDPDEVAEEKRKGHLQNRKDGQRPEPQQSRSYSYHSSKVTYGGINGAYYTSSTTRRTASDGVIVEESKEADTTTGKATHRISRGINNKGHSVTRKLNSDGKVETMQTLHNLNKDELARFEEAWKGNVGDHLHGWGSHDVDKMNEDHRMPRRNEQNQSLYLLE